MREVKEREKEVIRKGETKEEREREMKRKIRKRSCKQKLGITKQIQGRRKTNKKESK
jgi:hypothetical protein